MSTFLLWKKTEWEKIEKPKGNIDKAIKRWSEIRRISKGLGS